MKTLFKESLCFLFHTNSSVLTFFVTFYWQKNGYVFVYNTFETVTTSHVDYKKTKCKGRKDE